MDTKAIPIPTLRPTQVSLTEAPETATIKPIPSYVSMNPSQDTVTYPTDLDPSHPLDSDAKPKLPFSDAPSAPYTIYSDRAKSWIVIGGAAAAFFSPMTQQIYFPALTSIADEFHISDTDANLTISTYMIFQGLTPMFMGNFADKAGRRPAYMACFIIYIAANIGLALAPNYGAMLGLRCIQAAGSSTTVAMSFAVVSDVITSAERGSYVGITSLPIVLAPAIGPVLGGVVAQYLSWRAIFWGLAILAGALMAPFFMFMPETARHLAGDGSKVPPKLNQTGLQLLRTARTAKLNKQSLETATYLSTELPTSRKISWPNPMPSLRLLVDKEHSLILASSAAVFAGFYMLTSSVPSLFTEYYGFNQAQTGLVYLPLAAGSTLAAYGLGHFMDWNYRRHCKKLGRPYEKAKQESMDGFPIERIRYEVGIPLLILAAFAQIAWGWALHQHAHIAVMCVLMFFLGVGIIGFNNTTNSVIVDINRKQAASAAASNNLSRCLVGAGVTAGIVPLISKIGTGWTFTAVGIMYLIVVVPILVVAKRGVRWRQEKANKQRAACEANIKMLEKRLGNSEEETAVEEGQKEDVPGQTENVSREAA